MRKGEMLAKIFGAALAILAIFSICGALPGVANVEPVAASPGIIYVPDDYTKIQWAVDNATSGDTIIVRNGTYPENIYVNKAHLTIRSENGAGSTIVRAANPDAHVFEVTADWVNITGFTVEGATEYPKAGIYLGSGVNDCNISSNNVTDNYYGIQLSSSSNNTLTNNIASNNSRGIYLDYSSNYNMLTNNTVLNNTLGIWLCSSSNNNLINNTMSGNRWNFGVYGDQLSHFMNDIDTSNKVDGKPIYYWVNHQDEQVPQDAGFVGIVNCTNITAKDLILTNNMEGVLFAYTDSSRIENVTVSNNFCYGMYLYYLGNTTLTNNTANSNSLYGMYLYSSSDNTLTNNTADSHHSGIYLDSSSNNVLSNNTAERGYRGIRLRSSSNNTLTDNTASSNNDCGIYLDSSSNNTIYNNYFNNTNNAYDDGNNAWNITKTLGTNIIGGPYLGGNYWSDYSGNDTNGDGLGDTPYNITGDSNKDYLPLVPSPPPVPVWSVGDNWVYNCSYENPEGTPKYEESELTVAVVGEVAAGEKKGINEDSYKLSGIFVPPATRDSADMPLTLHIDDVDIWNSKDHLEYLKQSLVIAELPGLPTTITWNYTGDYGWPYGVGKTWAFTVHTVAGPLDETVDREAKVLGVEAVTVPAGTFECYHIVTYDPASPDNYTFEHWFNATLVKNGVKMIDRDTWAGEETRVLTSYSVETLPAQHNLTINSTSGGNVTTPGEGTFTYNASEVVDLVATADSGYQFVNWTGDVGTIADVDSAATNIVMTGNYYIMANFAEGAAEMDSEWDKVGTPYHEDWTIAPNSDILVPASIPGGEVIYVVGSGHEDNNLDNDYGPRLWKSDDSGVTWDDLADNVWDADGLPSNFVPGNSDVSFNYVACGQDDPDFVAVALVDDGGSHGFSDDEQAVVISYDGGDEFAWTGDIDDSSANSILTRAFDMKVSDEDDGKRNFALGGAGTKAATYPQGLVFCYEIGGLGGGWVEASAYDGWDNINDDVAGNEIASEAVTRVAFAPSWLADKTVLAVSHTDNGTYLQSGTWGNTTAWNEPAGFEPAVLVVDDPSNWSIAKGTAAGLALPADYEGRHASSRYAWVYVDRTDGNGVIYRVTNGAVIEVNQQISGKPWLASIAYMGTIDEGKALAGLLGDGVGYPTECCEGVQVYRNDGISDMDICCQRWDDACKPPTGTMAAMVGYATPNKAYAFVGGIGASFEEGAFSFSLDDGDTWNQIGLVDTYIDYLSDVAKSPNCNKTWVVSVNVDWLIVAGPVASSRVGNGRYCECDSVWLNADPLPEASEYSGAWIREWCKELTYEEGLLRLAPEETGEALTVYLVDRWTDTVYYDGNEGLGCWEQGSSTVDEISDLAVQDEATIYVVGYDADVAVSNDHGATASWSSTMDSKVDEGHTIAVLGEGNVLVGGADGKVSYSDDDLATFLDGEASFTKLDDIGEGDVHVAFDSYFDSNSVIYAAVGYGGDDNGIYRWVIGESSKWKDLGECTGTATPSETQLGLGPSCDRVEVGYHGMVLSNADGNPETDATSGGVLYAAYAWYDYDTDAYYTGVARCLNPAEEIACGGAMWDYLIQGVAADAAFTLEPSSLKICGCLTPDTNSKLWAIDDYWYYDYFATDDEDSSLGRLWTYEDCYAKSAPVLVAPADGAGVSCDPHYWWNDAFMLKWERQCDACSYNLQISLDEDFTGLVLDIGGRDVDCQEIDYEPTSGSNPGYVVAEGALGPGSCDTTFYWRVRSADAETGEIIHSPWSETRSFTVAGETKRYNLTISSTDGGNVTTPGEGTFSYNASEVVDLVATADTGYQFVNWTGDTGAIGDVNSATTNIAMTANYSITANFGPKSRPSGGGGGGGQAPCYLDIDMLGSMTTVRISCATSRTLESVVAPDVNNTNFLEIDYGTTVICPELGEAPEALWMRVANQSPPVPDGSALIGPAYNFTGNYGYKWLKYCSGVTFGQNVTIVLDYDPNEVPESTTSLAVAYYDTELGIWVSLSPDIGRVAEVGKATGMTNRFSTVAVIAELAPTVTPASFVGSALNIEQGPQVWKNFFVGVTGEDVTITANVANNGGQEGTYIAELKLNGETVDAKEVTLAAGQSQQVTFTLSGMDYGQYEIEVAGLSGEFTVSRIIDWWSIFGIILAVGLITWAVIWGRRRRKRAQPAQSE